MVDGALTVHGPYSIGPGTLFTFAKAGTIKALSINAPAAVPIKNFFIIFHLPSYLRR